ncbi:MAG: tetratricopeptide repeat protein [Gammaproteobacteria bacterium]|nr:tetratricopeptide repeat protein [Gammaproteobacteria bacterium]MDH4313286.1 tetratricopeptide repeat protein [Gammaproteobacteria bacterium]MDH5212913.1 tetratricopeptide repeat protein [Gammaproteobacteria bacterium]MDH5500551.1 tetratricopeptide repeat protein [Gammaproteobacteria bacterium]
MKSLLVDALREAQSDAAVGVAEEAAASPAAARVAASADAEVLPRDSEDLTLLDTGVAVAFNEEEFPADRRAVNEFADIDETQLLPVLAEGAALDAMSPDHHGPLWAAASAADLRMRQGWYLQLGRWSPALCLLAMSMTAGAYVLYQKLTARQLNIDLSQMSSQVSYSADADREVPNRPQLPDSSGQFSFSDRRESMPRPDGPAPQRADKNRPSVKSATQSSDVSTGSRSRGIVIGISAGSRAPISDPAFADVQAGFDAYQEGQLAIAETRYRAALDVVANHRIALAGLAAVLQRTGRTGDAVTLYERLLDIDPADGAVAAELLSLSDAITPAQRESELKLLLQRHPEVSKLHFALGMHFASGERWPEAARTFADAQTLEPGNAAYSYNLALSFEHLGRIAEARYYYEQALQSSTIDQTMDRQLISRRLDKLALKDRDRDSG